jgi:hypothetical protein
MLRFFPDGSPARLVGVLTTAHALAGVIGHLAPPLPLLELAVPSQDHAALSAASPLRSVARNVGHRADLAGSSSALTWPLMSLMALGTANRDACRGGVRAGPVGRLGLDAGAYGHGSGTAD